MTGERTLDDRVLRVVSSGNCSGCGACCLLDSGLEMRLAGGYARPQRVEIGTLSRPDAARIFDRVCPGSQVAAAAPTGAVRHPVLGPVIASWQAWATDPQLRHRGSSGGVLSALSAWLVSTGEAPAVTTAMKDPAEPRRTSVHRVTDPAGVAQAAGSRYAPVGCASDAPMGDERAVFVGKPCEASALRALGTATGQDMPLVMSFFCAGTPSQDATDRLVADLVGEETVTDLWYRGHGWPGRFTVTTDSGREESVTYDESWGGRLGPTMQWRCKICPDGVGESADIVAADFWAADEAGYPVFAEQEGVSALLARTERGRDVIERALMAGVIEGAALSLDDLARVQPFQVRRRSTLFARLLGTRFARRIVPRYRGFGLAGMALRDPKLAAQMALGSYRRARRR